MIALLLIFFASCCGSLTNLLFRKNLDHSPQPGSHYFLIIYFLGSFLFALLSPALWKTPINWVSVGLGSSVGALNVALMTSMAQALRTGPSGLSFAFQNATAVFPGTILYLFFGTDFGFSFSYLHLVGIALVVYGLFVGTQRQSTTHLSKWLLYALACGTFQVLSLTLMQGRCILFQEDQLGQFLSSFALHEGDDAWFMPAQFGTASLLQLLFFFRHLKSEAHPINTAFGVSAGISNGACTLFILLATKVALPAFKVILFPCFAAMTIILCNLWAYRLYKERFNFQANLLCAAGILLGILA